MQHNLQSHEIIVLKSLEDGKEKTIDELVRHLRIDQAALMRASLTLQKEGLAGLKEKETFIAKLTKEGEIALRKGLPEKQLIREIIKIGPEANLSFIKFDGKNIAIGYAKKKGYIDMRQTEKGLIIAITKKGKDSLEEKSPEELLLKRAIETQKVTREELELLKSRKLIDYASRIIRSVKATSEGISLTRDIQIKEEVSTLTPELIKSGGWKGVNIRRYNVVAPVKPAYPGKRHFVAQATEYMRRIYLELGFREMEGPLVNTAFWNFDALFTAQDHPVRDLQDTFYIEGLKGRLPEKGTADRVRKMHEEGNRESKGWQYRWDPEEARKIILRTHTTVLSAKTLARLKKDDWPAKYFAIGKCFRNETLDWSHLFEFNQFEGIVVDENANFRNLLGYLKEFFKKLGFAHARYRPAYFPYTEMSVEIDVMHPVHKQWIELGGAGIFRPEVVEPLLKQDVPVLAWGPGFDRILMDYYRITDIRDLYRNDISQLREKKLWMW